MKILLTGASGFLGQKFLYKVARESSYEQIFCLVKTNNIHLKSSKIKILVGDLSDPNTIGMLPEKIDVVIHLAAVSNTFLSSDKARSQFLDNVKMTINILNYCERTSVKKIIYSSSVYIYSGVQSNTFNERDINLPNESLGASKLACESLIKFHSFQNNTNCICLRFFTVYGPGSSERQFITQAIIKISNPDDNSNFRNPSIKRDFIYIDDAINAIYLAMNNNLKNKFIAINIGSGKSLSIKEVLKLIRDKINKNKKISFDNNKDILLHLDKSHFADIKLANDVLGWTPEVDLEDGIDNTIDSISNY